MSGELRPDRCPICGGLNECAMAAGKTECWCANVTISEQALARVPEEAKGKVCLCAKCASVLGATERSK